MTRYGTLRCLLFGHKFVERVYDSSDDIHMIRFYNLQHYDFCIRCGIKEPVS